MHAVGNMSWYHYSERCPPGKQDQYEQYMVNRPAIHPVAHLSTRPFHHSAHNPFEHGPIRLSITLSTHTSITTLSRLQSSFLPFIHQSNKQPHIDRTSYIRLLRTRRGRCRQGRVGVAHHRSHTPMVWLRLMSSCSSTSALQHNEEMVGWMDGWWGGWLVGCVGSSPISYFHAVEADGWLVGWLGGRMAG